MPDAAAPRPNLRPSLFDYLDEAERDADRNAYTSRSLLTNEASVEEFFVSPLLRDLGYVQAEVKPKNSLDEMVVGRGRRKEAFRPDYALICGGKPRWLVDAKAPDQPLENWVYQGAGYALALNQAHSGENPCMYFALTNGYAFNVFRWDELSPILTLEFPDFTPDNPKFRQLRELLGAQAARAGWATGGRSKQDQVVLRKPRVEEVKLAFNRCHQLIWKTEKMNPQPAFFEFVKIMFVKLWEDRRLHEDPTIGPLLLSGQAIPRTSVVFSNAWIEEMQKSGVENPVNTVLFKRLHDTLKDGVRRGRKKPIFTDDEGIRLQTGTIKQVVSKLEGFDLFGMDEDLNGRLFETFLGATMRGQSLGQYFTPRSVAKLMTKLANPQAGRTHVDRVIDACCGTGGFLIETLTVMRDQIRGNASLTQQEASELLEKVANESIFGIDAGREPPIARIARINMYLHGDGGSRIYAADSLDKGVSTGVEDDPQSRAELEELREMVRGIAAGTQPGFDIVLSNPPFSMGYSDAIETEQAVLKAYALGGEGFEGTDRRRATLTSNVMFIERYVDLLRPGGKLVTVIDDAVLSGKRFKFARDFIRKHYIIRAVISLPGDAFQRVGARAKTSVLYLEKRGSGSGGQPAVFMTECQSVGMDDMPVKTRPTKAAEARQLAKDETDRVLHEFASYLAGKPGPWLVPAAALSDRLDVKSCLPRGHDVVKDWRSAGLEVVSIGDVLSEVTNKGFNPNGPGRVGKRYTMLRVSYDGIAGEGEEAVGGELTYNSVQHPTAGDLVASNVNAGHGSIAVIPPGLTHTIASSEFTIMRMQDERFHPWFVWAFLRSTEVRARLLSQSSGTNRQRVGWDDLRAIPIPVVAPHVQAEIGENYRRAVEAIAAAEQARLRETNRMNGLLDLENEWAVQRMRSARPPR